MSRISLSAYRLKAAPERRLGFGQSASTREARAQESQFESQVLGKLEGVLKQCGRTTTSQEAIKEWFCVHGVKGHGEKGLIRVLVYIRVWSAVLRGEGVDVQGPDIDAAENMARQAFGACLCAVNALYSVVSKLGGPETKEKEGPKSQLVTKITDLLPRLLEVMAGAGDKPRPRGFHVNELAKLKKIMGPWKKRAVLTQPVLHDLDNLLATFDHPGNVTKANGDPAVDDHKTAAGPPRHKKHTAWILTMDQAHSSETRNGGPVSTRAEASGTPTVAGVGLSPSASTGPIVSPPGPGTELERKIGMESALKELFAVNVKTSGEWWGTAYAGIGPFREGPEGHWSIHLRRAREEAHRRRKQGRGLLLGVDGRNGDQIQDDMERAVAAGDRRVAAKHEQKLPKHRRGAAEGVRTSGGKAPTGGGRGGGKDDNRTSDPKADAAAEDSDAHMEVDEERPSDNDSMPSTPSTVPSEASPSPEPEPEPEPEPSPLPATSKETIAHDGADPTKKEAPDSNAAGSPGGTKHAKEPGSGDVPSKSDSRADDKDKNKMRQGKEGSEDGKPSVSRVMTEREKEEEERQRRRENLRRAGKERGKKREAEKQRLRQEKERERQRKVEEKNRAKAADDKILREARENAAALAQREEANRRAQEHERREAERPRDGNKRDRGKGRDDRTRSDRDSERGDAREKDEGRNTHVKVGHSRERPKGRGDSFDERGKDGEREREREPSWRSGHSLPTEDNRRLVSSREGKLEKSERKRRRSDAADSSEFDRAGGTDRLPEKSSTRRVDDSHDDDYSRDRPRKKKSKKDKKEKKDSRHGDSREEEESRGRKRSRDSGRGDTVNYARLTDDRDYASRRGRSRDPHRSITTDTVELMGLSSASGTDRKDVVGQGTGTLAREDLDMRGGAVSAREDKKATSSRSAAGVSVSSIQRSISPLRASSRSGGHGHGHGKGAEQEGERVKSRNSRERNVTVAPASPRKAGGGVSGGSGIPGMDAYGSGASSGRAASEERSSSADRQGNKRRKRDAREDRDRGEDDRSRVGDDRGRTGDDRSRGGHDRSRVGDDRTRGSDERGRAGDDRDRTTDDRSRVGVDRGRAGDDRSRTGDDRSRTGDDRSRAEHDRSRMDNRSRAGDDRNRGASDTHGPSSGGKKLDPTDSRSSRRREGERDGAAAGRHQQERMSPGRHEPLVSSAYAARKEGEERSGGRVTEKGGSSRSGESGRDSGRRRGDAESATRHSRSSSVRGSGRSADRPPSSTRDVQSRWRPSSPHGSFDSRDPEWGRSARGADLGMPGRMAGGGGGRFPAAPAMAMGGHAMGMAPYDRMGLGGQIPQLGIHGSRGDSRERDRRSMMERDERRRRGDREEHRRRSEERWHGSSGGGRDEHSRRSADRVQSPQQDDTPVDPPQEEEPEEGELVIETTTKPPVSSSASASLRSMRWGHAANRSAGDGGLVGADRSGPSRGVIPARSKNQEGPTASSENGNGSGKGDAPEEEGEMNPAHLANTSAASEGAKDRAAAKANENSSSNQSDTEARTGNSQDGGRGEDKIDEERDNNGPSPSAGSAAVKKGDGRGKSENRRGKEESPAAAEDAKSWKKADVEFTVPSSHGDTLPTPSSHDQAAARAAADSSASNADYDKQRQDLIHDKRIKQRKSRSPDNNEPKLRSRDVSPEIEEFSKAVVRKQESPAERHSDGEDRRGRAADMENGKGAASTHAPAKLHRQPKHADKAEKVRKGGKVPVGSGTSENTQPVSAQESSGDSEQASAEAATAEGSRRRSAAVGDGSGLARKSQRSKQDGAASDAPTESAGDHISSPSSRRDAAPAEVTSLALDTPSDSGTPTATTASPASVFSRLGPRPAQADGKATGEGSPGKNGRAGGQEGVSGSGGRGGSGSGSGAGAGDGSGIVTWGPHRKRDRGAKEEKAVRPGGLIGRVFHDHLKTPRKAGSGGSSGGDGGRGGGEGT